ncbi:hypothetical protein ACLMJK_008767 [Lecanora helva]
MEDSIFTLQAALISGLPGSGFYIPNFISEEEEASLLRKIDSVPLPTWRNLSHRRLQAHPSPLSSNNTLLSAKLPVWLSDPIIPRILALPVGPNVKENVFSTAPHASPNHCLINEYVPGQGIHPHEDGDAYFPVVVTVSLGSHIVLDVKSKERDTDAERWRILQEPRSLLITTGSLYTSFLHGISEVKVDDNLQKESITNWHLLGDKDAYTSGYCSRKKRISLTFRDVKKVQSLGKAFAGLGRRP